jgi:hypothetical protein
MLKILDPFQAKKFPKFFRGEPATVLAIDRPEPVLSFLLYGAARHSPGVAVYYPEFFQEISILVAREFIGRWAVPDMKAAKEVVGKRKF